MSDAFYSIKNPTTGEYKEKGSKFLAFAFSVSSEEDVKLKLEGLRKQYHDARHHCYAYVIGLNNPYFRANDDGEPGHSAGDPILGQIRSFELINCLVVVIRYFGGTKLGVGGLVNAYKTATAEALSKAEKIEVIISIHVELKFNYASIGLIERWLEEFAAKDINRQYAETCKVNFQLAEKQRPILLAKIDEQVGISYDISNVG